jgi:hypothetical protein
VANLVELNKLQSFENVVEATACSKAWAQDVPPGTNTKKCQFTDVSLGPLSFGCSFNQKTLAEGKGPPCTN